MKNLQLLTLLVITMLSGCSKSDDIIPDDEVFDGKGGNFEVKLKGDENRDIKGDAFFVHGILTSKTSDENGSTLAITLVNTQNDDEVITITVGKLGDLDGISAGTYRIKLEPEDDDHTVNVGAFLSSSLTAYLNTSGEVILKEVKNGKVEGSFSVAMDNFIDKKITMSGNFVADGITENL